MTLKEINVTTFMEELQGEAESCETRAEVLHVIGEHLDRAKQLQESGLFGDGYHTFQELYAHRVRLFDCLMHAHRNHAWWSEKHHDGSFMPGWIIAGIETPAGPATYHLPVTETHHLPKGIKLERGKPWDGHTAADVVDRLLSLNDGWTEVTENYAVNVTAQELVVYQYSASVNTARGCVHWDGVVTAKLIGGIEDYRAVRAEIARDGNVSNPEQVQIHNLAMVGFQPAKAGE